MATDTVAGSGDVSVRHSGDADEVRPALSEAALDVEDGQDEPPTSDEAGEFDDLDWLVDIVDGDLFTPMEDRPARSFDFGADGYTASVNLGQELLQITAPDQRCGILYVRGSFASNPDAILARAQRRIGGKSTFGLKLVPDAGSDYETDFRSQGYVNFRWPIAEYRLENADSQPGTCIAFSFVRNGTIFQVLRLEPGELRQVKDDEHIHIGQKKPEGNVQCLCDAPVKDRRIKVRAGGTVGIRCPCRSHHENQDALYGLEYSECTISCTDRRYEKRLDIHLFVNGEMVAAEASTEAIYGPEITAAFDKDIILTPGRVTLVVAAFSLRDRSDPKSLVMPSSNDLAEDLGVSKSSNNATDRLWVHRIPIEQHNDFYDLCTAARCLEQILGVNSTPLMIGDNMLSPASSPKSRASILDAEPTTVSTPDLDSSEPQRKREAVGYQPQLKLQVDDCFQEPFNPLHRSKSIESSWSPLEQREPKKMESAVGNGTAHELSGEIIKDTKESSFGTQRDDLVEAQTSHATVANSKLEVLQDGTAKEPSGGGVTEPSDGRGSDEACSQCETRLGIALIRDIMCHKFVDLASSFWQIRFLVKAHNFLAMTQGSSIKPGDLERPSYYEREDSSLIDQESLTKIRTSYLRKIRFHLYHALVWIANARLDDNSDASAATEPYGNSRNEGCWFWEPTQKFESVLFAPIAICFVIRHCPEALPKSFCATLADNLDRLRKQYSRPMDLTRTDLPAKVVLLIWYSYGCFDQIHQWLIKTSPGLNINGFWNDAGSKTRAWQKKAEKAMATARKQLVGLYSDEYESVDRLSFLGEELGLVSNQTDKQSKSCISYARRRILERLDTTKLNSGQVLFDQDKSVRTSTVSPWELTCVNHHSRLMLWNDPETDRYDVDFVRSQCLRFLTSDFSYVCSWDMSKNDVVALWWDLDAATVVCSTSLDMRVGDILVGSGKPDEEITSSAVPQKSQRRPSKTPFETEMAQDGEPLRPKEDSSEQKDSSEDTIADLLRKQLDKQDKIIQALEKSNEVVSEFDWRTCEPPATFHLDAWVQSLDDTPELFRSAQTKTIQLRNGIQQYLLKAHSRSAIHRSPQVASITEDALAPPEWTESNIFEYFTVEEMRFLSVFNIGMNSEDEFYCDREGRLSDRRSRVGRLIRSRTTDEPTKGNGYGPSADETSMTMWIAYLAGYATEDSAGFMELPDRARRIFKAMTPEEKTILKDPVALKEVEENMKKNLLRTLNDCLLDQSTRHRIYFIQRSSPAVVKGFIYMWHTQALDTFDDHFRDSSHFFDTEKEDWITSITLSYWGCKKANEKSFGIFHEGRDKAPFPPRKVMLKKKTKAHIWRRSQRQSPEDIANNEIEEGSSSLVISGDIAGNWWTCSMVSTILSETAMSALIEPTTLTLGQFVHQPASGRCLIFLSYLGALCESISAEYEGILSELTDAIKLGRQVLKQGLDWTHGEEAIQKLKAMLWALEALRIFDDRLSESLDKIRDAKGKMQKYLSRGRRAEELERQCQILLEEFDKRYGRLLAVHIKIEQKIVQISRYREGISAVSNLEDTRAALTQNDTIRILTYITIAYLPLSFVAALFSVRFVSDNLDVSAFAGLLAGFLIATLLLARSLSTAITVWDHIVRKIYKMITRKPRNYPGIADMTDDEEEVEEEDIVTIHEKHSDRSSGQSWNQWPLLHKRRSKNESKTALANEKMKLPADVVTAIAVGDD